MFSVVRRCLARKFPSEVAGAGSQAAPRRSRRNRSYRREFLNKKRVTHDQANSGIPPAFQAAPDAWRWAAPRLTPWRNIEKNDYDFRSWTEGASEELLKAGCLYEYARESHEFRCILALDRRERGQFPGIPIKFERGSAGNVHLLSSGGETWLHDFADEPVANKSFAEVFRTNRSKVEKSLNKLASYNLYPKAVESPGRYINVPGMEEVVIDWRHYTNKEIAAEIARKRPKSEPEPNRKGREPQSKTLLKALSVMRIWRREPKAWKRLKLVGKVCRFKSCVPYEWPMTNAARAEMTRARKRALNAFEFWFPWGKPSNY